MRERLLLVAFALSGAAALMFELAWFHRTGLVFGNSLWAVTVVLSAFMAGLALGNGIVAAVATRIPVRWLPMPAWSSSWPARAWPPSISCRGPAQ